MFILLTDAKSGGLKCYQYSHYNEDGLHFIYLLDPKLQSPANFST